MRPRFPITHEDQPPLPVPRDIVLSFRTTRIMTERKIAILTSNDSNKKATSSDAA